VKSAAGFPNVLLLDAGAAPVALHVVSSFMGARERAAKESVLRTSGETAWTWMTDKGMPDLPPPTKWHRTVRLGTDRPAP
jgi:hypothetical protein